MKNLLMLVLVGLLAGYSAMAQIPQRKGLWRFDDPANLLKAEIGLPLELEGTQESMDGPETGNLATMIGTGSYLRMLHGIPAVLGEKVNEYSIQLDFSIPEDNLYHALIQITAKNTDDADMFINKTNQIGIWEAGYSDSTVEIGSWYRMVFTVLNESVFRIYMNGNLWREATPRLIDSRYALGDTLLLFADNDGEDPTILCSEAAIWDVCLSEEDVVSLGNASNSPTTGIAQNSKTGISGDLGQNYPNPFSHMTTFPYQIHKSGNVNFKILDLSGKVVDSIDEGLKTPGMYDLKLYSNKLKSGVYYVQMITNEQVGVRKMVVLK
jgi:hypothetical protein